MRALVKLNAAFAVMVVAAGCSAPPPDPRVAPTAPGPGLVCSWPRDGQFDVPSDARLLLTFSDAPSAAVLGMACTQSGSSVAGGVCVLGPSGLVTGAVRVSERTVVFTARWEAGATYRVFVDPALLPGATNLGDRGPLLTFTARADRPQSAQPPTLLTLNDSPPDAGMLPFLDVSPIHLLFSEPLAVGTVDSSSVVLRAPDGGAVEGLVVTDGTHVTFDPLAPLEAGQPYRLELSSALRDLGGQAFAARSLTLTPARTTTADGTRFEQHLALTPAWEGSDLPASPLAAMPVNTSVLSSQLIGENVLHVLPGSLTAKLGDPSAFGGPIPMLLERGQRLDLTSMSIHFGGALPSGLETGVIHFTLLTDATGFLTRNPFRAAAQLPDDAQAPVFVDLTMDALVTSEDAHGNVLSSQTVMGIRLLGTSIVDGDQLVVNQVGALEFSTLGVGLAPVALSLRLRSGADVPLAALSTPALTSSFPAAGQDDVPPDATLELNFSGPIDPLHVRDGVEVTLTQGATHVPVATRVEGGTLVVTPSARLSDATRYTLTVTGLRSYAGTPLASLAPLTFSTATLSAANPAPPMVTALVPGAPCALERATLMTPGSCVGGKASDTPYQLFTLPANVDVQAYFSEPMAAATVVLGATCGSGSLRIERLDATGTCAGVVPGTLRVGERSLRFTPDAPWSSGVRYRLTLVGGGNDACALGELCSRANKPLNTDPLIGTKDGQGGGPDLVVPFTGAAATPDNLQPLESQPFADLNGNGLLDPSETTTDGNRAAMEVTGHGGIVTSASLNGADCVPGRQGQQSCSYLHATLPVYVQGVVSPCPIDAQGRPSTAAVPCVRVRVLPNEILSTSLSMNTTAIGIVPLNNLATGQMVMRVREVGGPAYGYIMNEPGQAVPQFVINQNIYLDAPDLSILAGTVPHDLHSKRLDVTLKGPVTFRDDGRMDVALRNTADVPLVVNITALGLGGNIDMSIPAGEMRITLVGPLLR